MFLHHINASIISISVAAINSPISRFIIVSLFNYMLFLIVQTLIFMLYNSTSSNVTNKSPGPRTYGTSSRRRYVTSRFECVKRLVDNRLRRKLMAEYRRLWNSLFSKLQCQSDGKIWAEATMSSVVWSPSLSYSCQ